MKPNSYRRQAFSLLELVVIIAIVAILLAISIPVVRDMRSIARRSNCDQNLTRLLLACQTYAVDHRHLPSGTFSGSAEVWTGVISPDSAQMAELSISSLPEGYHHNWVSSLLPYLDRKALYDTINFDVGVYAPANEGVRETDLPFLRCPASVGEQIATTTSYAGLHASESVPIGIDDDGLLMLNHWIVPDEISDGISYTLLLGEKLSPREYDLGWMSGTRSSLRNAGTAINAAVSPEVYHDPAFVGGLGSLHPGGASAGMADGSIKFLQDSIDMNVYRAMVNRNDGKQAE
ncbi:DUF1559 family PulG-like putative transporter [Allorhodopirellula heiligendammensis]|uniref:DUF1559 domain-containing protein n=1 Tax=Allorhodopirellula heiligendammensis TaxID=2714739 RepID=A0A5C6C5Q9_9BACT|nr:DUF1559 domain-containing protein [Allorhodopirellula heiligendammensis]TWU19412.1 hypothetical protein Poly21_15850 [Allorhodopirellula heiligendammensis]